MDNELEKLINVSYRTVLVIGEDHKSIVEEYSTDKVVDKYVRYELNEAPKIHLQHLKTLEAILKAFNDRPERAGERQYYLDMYNEFRCMSDMEFYHYLVENEKMELDDNGNAMSTVNPNAIYAMPHCYDTEVRANQEHLGKFSYPFELLDGTLAYSAKKKEIDWKTIHLGKYDLYKAVWEVCVDGREPKNDDERQAKQIMSGYKGAFANFKTADEYIRHNCAFWTYGVATKDKYVQCEGDGIDWTYNFYDRFIVPLDDDERLSIYEVKLL